MNSVRIKSDGVITKIFLDDKEVKGLQNFSLSASVEERVPLLCMTVSVMNVEVDTKAEVKIDKQEVINQNE